MLVHRVTVREAILNASKSDKWAPCDDIAVDAAFQILHQVERCREEFPIRPQGPALYNLVAQKCFETGHDSGRRRLYQLVCMAYYRVLKARKAKAEKLRALRKETSRASRKNVA